jgi:hypothetical protein
VKYELVLKIIQSISEILVVKTIVIEVGDAKSMPFLTQFIIQVKTI